VQSLDLVAQALGHFVWKLGRGKVFRNTCTFLGVLKDKIVIGDGTQNGDNSEISCYRKLILIIVQLYMIYM